MQKQLTFHSKKMNIQLSASAIKANLQLESILLIEVQIYFSCLLGKRLAFYSQQKMDGTWLLESAEFDEVLKTSQALTDKIYIRFNTVMTKSCPVSDYTGPPPVTDFTIYNQTPYVPSWLNIDFKAGQWQGEYGWESSEAGVNNTKQIRG